MAMIRVRDFGKAALNTDVSETLLQPGEWTRLENIDIESGDIRSAWGDSLATQTSPIDPRYIFVFEGFGDTWLIVSDGNQVYAYDGTSWIDITPSDVPLTNLTWGDGDTIGDGTWGGAGDITWGQTQTGGTIINIAGEVSFTVFLGILVVSSSEGIPVYWPGETGRLQALPGWPAAWRCRSIVAFSNHLVAIALNDGVTSGDKYRVAWSDAAAEGEVPQQWTPSATNLAGSVQLRDSEGYLTTALPLRNELAIYKKDSIYRMYVRGDEFVMGFERVVPDRGCDSPNGVAALDDVHFFADRGDLRIYNGQITKSVATLRIKERLSEAISDEFRDATYVVAYPERDQVHVGVVPAGRTTIDETLIFNTVHNAWTRKLYTGAISMVLGAFAATSVGTPRTWGEQTGTWGEQEDTWGGGALEPTEDGIIIGAIVDGEKVIYRQDKTNTDYNGNPKSCIAERRGLMFRDIDGSVTVRGIYPEIEGLAEVDIEIGWQFRVGGPIRWTTKRKFRPGVDKKIPARVTGLPVAFRISSQSPEYWRLGAISYDVVPANGR